MEIPQFSWRFFLPKYWFTWLGLAILYLISWLPYRLQLGLGVVVGRLLYYVAKRRRHIAKTNIDICFPELSQEQRNKMLKANFDSAGIAFFESSMGWFWPKWRLKPLCHYEGIEHIEEAKKHGKGVLVVAYHMMCLEICGRILGLKNPNVAFYRPHNNALMEYFQYHGRARDNKYLIGAKNVKGLLHALANNESCIYLPDQDYGRRRCAFVPFFAEPQACTTTGTTLFVGQSNCQVVIAHPQRLKNARGYKITITPALTNYPTGNDEADAAYLNKLIEDGIRQAPEQYMWLHRRFKTRPEKNAPSVYK
ncbi:LpxL/LpxP family Kdo(2)-lipid IV(A) lauroyl/palmitoleoyl acyltransferase [Catenovulum agarivorans]|uniref:LpxL/LpxP family Kdo(2)-lipid IV(A) lauroyl/palmitoleoyl acyltransferase n=1 Tax=Catenovulum agarivorans TaxID=1172192 RepID=UPI000300E51A|nr:LpxL/LpxP family Kdo(2)-lipid IV(A) lauroyl/palmitoleoyl acyltransferase [Catenovulum agarivorans]